MTSRFLQQLDARPLLGDGAMGTMIYARGIPFERCFDELNLSNPALIADIHRAYIDAGSNLIETNTFGGNRFKLGEHGLAEKVTEINQAGVQLARRGRCRLQGGFYCRSRRSAGATPGPPGPAQCSSGSLGFPGTGDRPNRRRD